MGIRVAVLLFVVSVSLTEAAGCIPTSSPQCYKNSTSLQDDFMCKWDKRNPKENQTHTLYIWDSEKKSFILCANSGDQSEKYIILEELGLTTSKTDIWVQTQVGNLTCNSSKISVILECLVKYSAPQITRMKRSAGILSLKLDKPNDDKSAKYEIRWRERGSEWQNETFETEDSTSPDSYKLRLQKQTIYQIQLRRQAKLQPHICNDSLQTLWSDWSPVEDVPLEISLSLVHKLETKWTNGTRHINLTWDEPSAEQSVGGVKYMLNVVVWPCKNKERKKKKKSTSDRTYKTLITYSEARISIIATNKVGSSPPLQIVIPAVKHLSNCDKPSKITLSDQTCLEWYKLENGETRPSTINHSGNKTFKDIEKGVEKFVRHYYFLHTMGKKHLQTVDMCPFYSEQGAPIKGPGNVNISNVTHESAVVRWLSIPVAEQRGFLLHYLIWISGQGNTTLHEAQANETSFKIKNLQPGASYTVSIAGETMAGKGPNSTVNFETHSEEMGLSWQDQTILGVCVVALLCTIICSVAVRRFRNKLIPKVPSPVIDTSEIRCPQDQDLRQTEEVHEFVLLLCQDLSKPSENVTPEQSTLLQGFGLVVFEEEDEVDEEGEVTGLSSMKSCCYPNPSYRGQTLHLPEPFHTTDSALNDNDTESTYKNGLFFETSDKTSL
ncbi:leukemia inhibitory factor receptor-like isoform X3 [Pimephales promelas]|uniref:leukemia inhibitory factor receptor-like isoform X3 n=1 Tax=Pimephales promelas TaxID=90988 RepID=UPI001955BF2B|nr:leukemia inhibitory factor receptor-like isoform X3 [Pimephales promelas]KAG1960141.1 interleukin-12 receptor subunit beta-1 [Pimephales promelas]